MVMMRSKHDLDHVIGSRFGQEVVTTPDELIVMWPRVDLDVASIWNSTTPRFVIAAWYANVHA